MRRSAWVYIAIFVVIQALCLAQVECQAASWFVQGFTGPVSQRDMQKSAEAASLLQDVIRYIKASQAQVVFTRTPVGLANTWFGLVPVRVPQPALQLPALDSAIQEPQRESDAYLREASLSIDTIITNLMLAEGRVTEKTGPPVAEPRPGQCIV